MTTKKTFEIEAPEVVVLKNGRYAYRAKCPWEGRNGKVLSAFKFCSAQAYHDYQNRALPESESEHSAENRALPESESEHSAENRALPESESEHSAESEHITEDTA